MRGRLLFYGQFVEGPSCSVERDESWVAVVCLAVVFHTMSAHMSHVMADRSDVISNVSIYDPWHHETHKLGVNETALLRYSHSNGVKILDDRTPRGKIGDYIRDRR